MNEEAQFLEMIIKGIVQEKEAVKVTQQTDSKGILLELAVDKSDMGQVIGKQGKTATAIRAIMHAYGGQHDKRVSVVIDEPDKDMQQ